MTSLQEESSGSASVAVQPGRTAEVRGFVKGRIKLTDGFRADTAVELEAVRSLLATGALAKAVLAGGWRG